jgi:DNA modification methylase
MLRILQGDALEQLRTLPAQSVQCCVTSPPYWGLRDYGTAQWEGGDEGCDHKRFNGYPSGLQDSKESTYNGKFEKLICGKCGARRIDAQLGLEATPEEYIEHMVAVFREVWRVLRDDGTLWLNMGDAYAHNGACGGGSPVDNRDFEKYGRIPRTSDAPKGRETDRKAQLKTGGTLASGLKPKDLCMMPARVALALQADGWYLRSDIIWHKPNPMPESVTDRPTKAHEYIFLLTKAERYFYDAEAIREPHTTWEMVFGEMRHTGGGNKIVKNGTQHLNTTGPMTVCGAHPNGRNKRSVWTIPTQPYPEAHFATFPEDLVKPCILAGSKPGDVVLDPFAGSGTTGQVALELGRRAILIELNPKYVQMIQDRISVTIGMF